MRTIALRTQVRPRLVGGTGEGGSSIQGAFSLASCPTPNIQQKQHFSQYHGVLAEERVARPEGEAAYPPRAPLQSFPHPRNLAWTLPCGTLARLTAWENSVGAWAAEEAEWEVPLRAGGASSLGVLSDIPPAEALGSSPQGACCTPFQHTHPLLTHLYTSVPGRRRLASLQIWIHLSKLTSAPPPFL